MMSRYACYLVIQNADPAKEIVAQGQTYFAKATADRIPWCQALRDRFTARFLLVRRHDDQNNTDLPFRYLAGDGFWQVFEGDINTPINREIRVADSGRIFARFTDGFELLVAIPANRQLMREALIAR